MLYTLQNAPLFQRKFHISHKDYRDISRVATLEHREQADKAIKSAEEANQKG